jgi:hypothetical protein
MRLRIIFFTFFVTIVVTSNFVEAAIKPLILDNITVSSLYDVSGEQLIITHNDTHDWHGFIFLSQLDSCSIVNILKGAIKNDRHDIAILLLRELDLETINVVLNQVDQQEWPQWIIHQLKATQERIVSSDGVSEITPSGSE